MESKNESGAISFEGIEGNESTSVKSIVLDNLRRFLGSTSAKESSPSLSDRIMIGSVKLVLEDGLRGPDGPA